MSTKRGTEKQPKREIEIRCTIAGQPVTYEALVAEINRCGGLAAKR